MTFVPVRILDAEEARQFGEEVRDELDTLWRDHAQTLTDFHRLFYRARGSWRTSCWHGRTMMKAGTDVLMVQELIWMTRPDLIIETGTADGGSALFYADLMDLFQIEQGQVVSIELNAEKYRPPPVHPRLTCVHGSALDPAIVAGLWQGVRAHQRVMVVLDSAHDTAHVAAELDAYAPMVSVGQFLIVEDTNLGHEVTHDSGLPATGPLEAVEPFLARHTEFQVERFCERYLLTFNPGGYLLRVA